MESLTGFLWTAAPACPRLPRARPVIPPPPATTTFPHRPLHWRMPITGFALGNSAMSVGLKPGYHFKQNRLYLFGRSGDVALIESWPELRAVRKERMSNSWSRFEPAFRLVHPYRRVTPEPRFTRVQDTSQQELGFAAATVVPHLTPSARRKLAFCLTNANLFRPHHARPITMAAEISKRRRHHSPAYPTRPDRRRAGAAELRRVVHSLSRATRVVQLSRAPA